jgi:glutamate-5-semialdehyde dehydrogenase
MTVDAYCEQVAQRALKGKFIARAATNDRNAALRNWADALRHQADVVLKANADDLARGREAGLSKAMLDRLEITPARLEDMAKGLEAVAALPDPVGQVISGSVRPNGLEVRQVRVPLGVIFFIYESRPNVTVDAAALAIKSGNAIILRGGKEALATNRALLQLLDQGSAGSAVQLIDNPDRAIVSKLLNMPQVIDLVIPRGGESLIRAVAAEAKMPVLKHYQGNCHVYVDKSADLDMAERIVINAKCQRPGVCNAAESLLVHRDVAGTFLPRAAAALRQHGVELRGCTETRAWIRDAKPATDADYAAEYLDLILSIKVVDTLEAAIDHIERFGSHHTDAIVTRDVAAAQRFLACVDSAAVVVNASTRFHDGYELGLGAEIGISTDKFHARGPCGLLELTSYKWIVIGQGQTRT